MKSYVMDEDARAVLALLQRIDGGYIPTAKELSDMRKIRTARFTHLELTSLPESIDYLSQLTHLSLYGNQLESLPESIGNLSLLSELDVSGNQFTYLPESISNLSLLSKLNVSGNQLANLPESIGNLSQLTKLSAFNNYLTSLPESIGNLFQLTELDASNNQLTNLPESIGSLPELKRLMVSNNRLSSLPKSFGNLSGLSELLIIKNQFTELPKCLHEIKSLTSLHLSGNPIDKLPSWLGTMQQLTSLGLWRLELREVPPWLRQLSKLEELYLSSNPFKELPEWLGNMTSLKALILDHLQLTKLPNSLMNLELPFLLDQQAMLNNHFVGISMEETDLSIQPISLFDQSRDKSPGFQESRKLIEDYFKTPKVPIREAKVIFLGDGKVGKTYTIQRLLNDCRKGEYPTQETHGILIEDLYPKVAGQSYNVRVWDFGGQDIMHEMHRCFLTDRTCYVVMVDTRTDKQTGRARYWLRTVHSVAPKAPVLLLVNEISGGQNRDLDYSTLKQEFPSLVNVEFCSSLSASEEEFRQKVQNPIFQQALSLDSCKMDLPESWELVRQELLKQKNSATYYINRKVFHSLCDQYGVPSDNGLRAWLLTWFNDLGVCFSYHLGEDGQEQSTDYKILDPMWLTSAVYKIIWEKERTDDGLISLSEICRILEKPGSDAMKKDGIPCLENVSYNETECGYVLDIMRKFCISYPADGNTEFMPTLCKSDSKLDPTPRTWEQHAAYRFCYTFLPENVLHRLMIYCFANLRPGKRWRKGFWLECESQGLSAVIRTSGRDSEENELQIDVYAQNEKYEAWMWLQPLCQQIMKINEMLSLKAKSYILAENSHDKEWFGLDSVWYWKKQGKPDMQGEKSLFPIQSLLTLIYGRYYPDVERRLMDGQGKLQLPIQPEVFPQAVTTEIVEWIGLDISKPFEQFLDLQREMMSTIERNTVAIEQNIRAERMNTLALQQNTLTQQQTNDLLRAIRDGEVTLPQEVMTALTDLLRRSKEPALKTTGRQMKWYFWKDKGQLLRNLLGDAANLATVAPILVELGKTYGPTLLELLKIVAPI